MESIGRCAPGSRLLMFVLRFTPLLYRHASKRCHGSTRLAGCGADICAHVGSQGRQRALRTVQPGGKLWRPGIIVLILRRTP